ncbi:MAG TPA: sigma-70 family RNA polymerase sigma factor [Amycolatopsis sp.]|uniref:sigma-70 family RNA polymerase sigma factor n=1 Tax=Amycolatopsis sp. TaxID=37632 RepID=UPI002B499D0C|nr:sigma-70 family RNA polymerase sigma factor [Amycolatopsis sp.]HKS45031.1 sigma-70 family RNA polymerase sigma factor [Amycolatopsis sp.]
MPDRKEADRSTPIGLSGEAGERHRAALFGFVLALTDHDRQWAEDVVQETLFRAWRHAERIGDVRHLRPWLFTVARRIVIDDRRSRRSRPLDLDDADAAARELPGSEDPAESLSAILLRDAVLGLRPKYRMVLAEIYFHGRSTTEAARTLGLATGTVKSRLNYALRTLRTALAEIGVTDLA